MEISSEVKSFKIPAELRVYIPSEVKKKKTPGIEAEAVPSLCLKKEKKNSRVIYIFLFHSF